MQTAVGLLIAIFGVVFAYYRMQKAEKKAAAMPKAEPIHPIPIEDGVQALKAKIKEDPSARQYVELYGLACNDQPVTAPLTEHPASYYHSTSYAVEKADLHNNLVQYEVYEECGPDDFYIMDETSDEKIYVDMESFGDLADLPSQNSTYEKMGSRWMNRHLNLCSRFFPKTGPEIQGYRLEENYYFKRQPLNIAGDLYLRGKKYRIARSWEGKRSAVTYKLEGQPAQTLQKARLSAVGLGLILVMIGIGVMIAGFR